MKNDFIFKNTCGEKSPKNDTNEWFNVLVDNDMFT